MHLPSPKRCAQPCHLPGLPFEYRIQQDLQIRTQGSRPRSNPWFCLRTWTPTAPWSRRFARLLWSSARPKQLPAAQKRTHWLARGQGDGTWPSMPAFKNSRDYNTHSIYYKSTERRRTNRLWPGMSCNSKCMQYKVYWRTVHGSKACCTNNCDLTVQHNRALIPTNGTLQNLRRTDSLNSLTVPACRPRSRSAN